MAIAVITYLDVSTNKEFYLVENKPDNKYFFPLPQREICNFNPEDFCDYLKKRQSANFIFDQLFKYNNSDNDFLTTLKQYFINSLFLAKDDDNVFYLNLTNNKIIDEKGGYIWVEEKEIKSEHTKYIKYFPTICRLHAIIENPKAYPLKLSGKIEINSPVTIVIGSSVTTFQADNQSFTIENSMIIKSVRKNGKIVTVIKDIDTEIEDV